MELRDCFAHRSSFPWLRHRRAKSCCDRLSHAATASADHLQAPSLQTVSDRLVLYLPKQASWTRGLWRRGLFQIGPRRRCDLAVGMRRRTVDAFDVAELRGEVALGGAGREDHSIPVLGSPRR